MLPEREVLRASSSCLASMIFLRIRISVKSPMRVAIDATLARLEMDTAAYDCLTQRTAWGSSFSRLAGEPMLRRARCPGWVAETCCIQEKGVGAARAEKTPPMRTLLQPNDAPWHCQLTARAG